MDEALFLHLACSRAMVDEALQVAPSSAPVVDVFAIRLDDLWLLEATRDLGVMLREGSSELHGRGSG